MSSFKKLFLIILIIFSLSVIFYFNSHFRIQNIQKKSEIPPYENKNITAESALRATTSPARISDNKKNCALNDVSSCAENSKKENSPFISTAKNYDKNVLLDIPFTVQAPFANWKDAREQDSCEEASVLMVMKWIRGEKLTPEEAEVKLTAISDWELREYNNFTDTSAEDTMKRLIKKYFKYENVGMKEDITLSDIKQELAKGAAIIVPMDGQKLKNPYYTAPGPERHMIVIRGYDNETKEFITNDSGTRRGEGYRYDENNFYAAIRDYPTGDHLPIMEIKKTMIMVKK